MGVLREHEPSSLRLESTKTHGEIRAWLVTIEKTLN